MLPAAGARRREPVEIDGGTNIVIDGVRFARQDHGDTGTDGCPPNDNFHLEIIRLQDAVRGFTLRNSYFEPGNRANTAVIFNTYMGGISTDIAVLNKFFGGTEGVGAFQVGGPGGTSDCKDQLIAYNTFEQGYGAWQCTSYDNVRFVGNLGWRQGFGDCTGEFDENVWQDTHVLQCAGTDTWVPGARFQLGDLALGKSLAPTAGSPAIDAAETPGDGDVCTEPRATAAPAASAERTASATGDRRTPATPAPSSTRATSPRSPRRSRPSSSAGRPRRTAG